MERNIKRIVLTGGPCAGKTTALARIVEHFSSLGYQVFTLPEVPTMFTAAGMNYLTTNKAYFYEGEKATLEIQLALEDKFMRMAQECGEPSIIVCDRGTMDISAYMEPEMWERICYAVGTSSAELRERYDAVLHLVSAADGAEQYYTTANNAQRYEEMNEEGLRIARSLDKKVIKAWTGHPLLRVINNHDDFDAKMRRVLKEISSVLELPQPIEQERKYRIEITGELPADCIENDITQTYLNSEPGTEVRLRTGPGTSHQVLRKVNTSGGAAPNDELVASRQKVSGDGREWYHVLYVPAWREPEGYMPTDAWICADFVQASELTPIDRAAVDLDRFGIARTGAGRQGAPGKAPALWRGADKTHMTYVGFAGDRVLKRDVLILSSELTTEDVIETFRITSRNGGGFCAKNEEDTHYVDSSERLVRLDGWNIDELCGTIAGDKLTLSDGTVLKTFNGNVGTAFPKGVLKREGK